MKIRIGALEVEVDTKEQLDELIMRYGGAAVAVVDAPALSVVVQGEAKDLTESNREMADVASLGTSPGSE